MLWRCVALKVVVANRLVQHHFKSRWKGLAQTLFSTERKIFLLRSSRKYIILKVCTFLLFSFSFFDVSQSLSYCRWINMVVLKSSEYAPFRIIRFTLFTKIISTRVTWGFNVFLENKIINKQQLIKMFRTRITNSKSPLNLKKRHTDRQHQRWVKVTLHGTIRNDDFYRNTALQCWNNVVPIQICSCNY